MAIRNSRFLQCDATKNFICTYILTFIFYRVFCVYIVYYFQCDSPVHTVSSRLQTYNVLKETNDINGFELCVHNILYSQLLSQAIYVQCNDVNMERIKTHNTWMSNCSYSATTTRVPSLNT